MERRVKSCCAANPECIYKTKCTNLYDHFVDETWDRKEIYSRLREMGLGGIDARNNLSVKRVNELAAQLG